MSRKKVLILRGNSVNPWDLRPLKALEDEYEFRALVPTANQFEADALGIAAEPIATLASAMPPGPLKALASRAPINRSLRAAEHFAWADIVHSAELSTWFSAEAGRMKKDHDFTLCVSAWETLPFKSTYRNKLSADNRATVLASANMWLAMTERARDTLQLEGVAADRIAITYPGIDVDHFKKARESRSPSVEPLIISPGRLVWEKGHQDLMRAIAALASGTVQPTQPIPQALIVGAGPEEKKLRAYAADLGIEDRVEFAGTFGYDEMVGQYARADAMFLGSIPVRMWEEQFGMVLAEAMAAGLPIIAARSGAIPEVVGDAGELFDPGDWLGLAKRLATFNAGDETDRLAAQRDKRADLFSTAGAASRVGAAYAKALTLVGSPA